VCGLVDKVLFLSHPKFQEKILKKAIELLRLGATRLVIARRAHRALTSRAMSTEICDRRTDDVGPYGATELAGAVI